MSVWSRIKNYFGVGRPGAGAFGSWVRQEAQPVKKAVQRISIGPMNFIKRYPTPASFVNQRVIQPRIIPAVQRTMAKLAPPPQIKPFVNVASQVLGMKPKIGLIKGLLEPQADYRTLKAYEKQTQDKPWAKISIIEQGKTPEQKAKLAGATFNVGLSAMGGLEAKGARFARVLRNAFEKGVSKKTLQQIGKMTEQQLAPHIEQAKPVIMKYLASLRDQQKIKDVITSVYKIPEKAANILSNKLTRVKNPNKVSQAIDLVKAEMPKVIKPGEVGGVVKPPLKPTTIVSKAGEAVEGITQPERGFIKTLKGTEITAPEVQVGIKGTYQPITNKATVAKAKLTTELNKFVTNNYDLVKRRVINEPLTAETNTLGQELMKKAQAEGRYDEAIQIAETMAKKGTEAGQGIQAFSIWSKMTPEGMLKYATKTVNDANERLGIVSKTLRGMFGKAMPKIDVEDAKFITDTMKQAQIAPEAERARLINQVMERINKKVPWGISDALDTYRYNNMLSNPLTHLRNAVSNLIQASFTRPATLAASGRPIQAAKYEYGALKALPSAITDFVKTIRNPGKFGKMDQPTKRLLGRYNLPSDLMEAGDVFFRKLIEGGESARGATPEEARLTGEYSLFRAGLKPEKQGAILNKIDDITNQVYGLRKVGLGWFIPFIRTPMNVAKQWIEYSPLGGTTMIGAGNKSEQFGKAMIGSLVTLVGADLALQNRVTWDAPTDPTQKDLFYASGRKPFSVKIGDKWVPMQSFGVFAFALGLPAAVKYYTTESKTALTDGDITKLAKIATSGLNFWSQQTFVSGLGSFVKLAQGDTDYNWVRNLSQPLSQLKPMTGLMTYIANLIDPVFRKPKGFVQQLKVGVPGLTQGMQPYTNPLGQPETRNWTNYLLPYGAGQENKTFEKPYQQRTIKLQSNALVNQMKQQVKDKQQVTGTGEVAPGVFALPDGRFAVQEGDEIKEFKNQSQIQIYQFEKVNGENDINKAQYSLDYQRAKRNKDLNKYIQVSQDRLGYLQNYIQLLDPKEDKKKIITTMNEMDDIMYYMNLYGGYGGFTKGKASGKVSKKGRKAKTIKIKVAKAKTPKLKMAKISKLKGKSVKYKVSKLTTKKPKIKIRKPYA